MKITYGNVSLLLTGDIEIEAEKSILQNYEDQIDCTILKVPHHGSVSSSSEEFLDAVSPKIAIIQCGEDNKFGHPHKETIEKYKARACKIYRTDLNGAITITADKNRIKSKTTVK